jgi:hypothetical protein
VLEQPANKMAMAQMNGKIFMGATGNMKKNGTFSA